MKTNKTICLLLTLGLFFQSCRKGSMWGIKGEGENITETRAVGSFSAIDLSIEANITFVQDSVYSLAVTAQKNILTILDIKTEGGTLKMDYKRNIWQHNKPEIVIHGPEMKKITISGSGNVELTKGINANSLDLGITGSGNISIPTASLQSLNARLSGSGSININSGTSKSTYFDISGSGNINTEFLSANNTDAKISGTGNIVLNASNTLHVSISGTGNVSYRGFPAVTSNISGSGKLIHLD